jgi:hypothetical protein
MSTKIPAAVAALLLAVAACDSSTAPRLPSPARSAEFFDSIYAARVATGKLSDSAYAILIAVEFELGPAYGGQETQLDVTTASGRQQWFGFGYAQTDNQGDTIYSIAAFSDRALTHLVYIGMARDEGGASLYFGNPLAGYRDSTIAGSWGSPTGGAPCALQAGLQATPWLMQMTGPVTCQSGTFTLSTKVTFLPVVGVGPLQVWSLNNSTFHGPIFSSTIAGPVGTIPGPQSRSFHRE